MTTDTKLLTFNLGRFATASLIYRNDHKLSREQFSKILGISPFKLQSLEERDRIHSVELVVNFCLITGNDLYSFFD